MTIQSRPYQHRIHASLLSFAIDGGRSALVESPTGSGKTFIALRAAKAIADSYHCPTRVVWATLHDYLRQQAISENERLGVGLNNLQPMSVFASAFKPFAGKTILVLDEAHHAAANTCMGMLEALQPDFYIGLSATPKRGDRCDLPFQMTVREASYDHLIENGWLASYDHFAYSGKHTPENVARVFLSRDWGSSVLYFQTGDEARECHHLLRQAGRRVSLLTGADDDAHKERTIARLISGEDEAVINMKMLTEGFDCPSLQTVFIRDSASPLVTTQMGGRVLRPFGTVIKNVVQSAVTKCPFVRTATPRRKLCEEVTGEWVELLDRREQVAALLAEHAQRRGARIAARADKIKKVNGRGRNFFLKEGDV